MIVREGLQHFIVDAGEPKEDPVWSWSIAGNGTRESLIDLITSAPAVDGDGIQLAAAPLAQFEAARTAALAQLNAMIPGVHVTIGISGNDGTYSPTITWAPARQSS